MNDFTHSATKIPQITPMIREKLIARVLTSAPPSFLNSTIRPRPRASNCSQQTNHRRAVHGVLESAFFECHHAAEQKWGSEECGDHCRHRTLGNSRCCLISLLGCGRSCWFGCLWLRIKVGHKAEDNQDNSKSNRGLRHRSTVSFFRVVWS